MVSFFYGVLCVRINYFEYAIFRDWRRRRHVLLTDGKKTDLPCYLKYYYRTLFPNFHGRRSRGRDVWQALQLNPVIFWYMTGETPETLEVVVAKIYGEVTLPRHWPRTPRMDRRRRCILDVRNRVLLVFIWLRQYLKLHVLAYIFCNSIQMSPYNKDVCFFLRWPTQLP